MTGNKIISLTAGDMKVNLKDSCQFIQAKLSSLPAMFGFEDEGGKGHFPHRLASEETLGLTMDMLPAMKYYYLKQMSEEERQKFFEWYEENRHKRFNFMEEAVRYCLNDVL